MTQVKNSSGKLVDFDAAVQHMDDELREALHGGHETAQAFFSAYEKAHEARFGEDWFLSGPNPVW